MRLTMRPANMGDSDRLLAWRNDPVTQANSRSTAPVPEDAHRRWMTTHVQHGYPVHLVMMADSDQGLLGCVRFDAWKNDNMHMEVSITLAPEHRGQSLAAAVLSEACECMTEFTLHAEVRAENRPSRRIFERCGFEEVGSDHGFVSYRKGHA